MHNRAFEALRRTLVAEGMSRAYAARFAEEVGAHFEDIVRELKEGGATDAEALRSAEARVGDVGLLARAAVERYREQTVMGRQAWLFFALLPVVIVPVTILAPLVVIALALDASGMMQGGIAPEHRWMWRAGIMVLALVYPAVIGMAYYRAARRRALAWRWRLVACGAAVAWGTWLHYGLWFKGAAERHGMFSIALEPMPNVLQGVVIGAAIGAYMWKVERRARREPLLGG